MRVGQNGESPTKVIKHLCLDSYGNPNPENCTVRREKLDFVAVCKVYHCLKYKCIYMYMLTYNISERIHK